MAHALEAYLYLSSRNAVRVRSARPILAHASQLPANARERLHLAAIAALLAAGPTNERVKGKSRERPLQLRSKVSNGSNCDMSLNGQLRS
jgi:hypothetical protein